MLKILSSIIHALPKYELLFNLSLQQRWGREGDERWSNDHINSNFHPSSYGLPINDVLSYNQYPYCDLSVYV